MGNEASSEQIAQRGVQEDLQTGNVFSQNQNCALQHLKLADWEKSGIRIHDPIPINRNQVTSEPTNCSKFYCISTTILFPDLSPPYQASGILIFFASLTKLP